MASDKAKLLEAKEALNQFVISNPKLQKFTKVDLQGDFFSGFNTDPICAVSWTAPKQVIAVAKALGFDTMHGDAFGIFAGTAINDTSSVTAAASTWDSMWNLGSATLNKAVTVKLTRTLAIIPITLGLSFIRAKKERQASNFSLKRAFPMFILYFILAAIFTTICVNVGVDSNVFAPLKELSKFLIVVAMAAIALNSNVIQLIKTGGKPIAVGATCWCGITIVSLVMQHVMHIW